VAEGGLDGGDLEHERREVVHPKHARQHGGGDGGVLGGAVGVVVLAGFRVVRVLLLGWMDWMVD
jgi:hypothetical protein